MSPNPTIPEFSLKGKKAIVTGGARGLGLEMSKALAESGADVAMMYVHNDQAQELAAQISKENNVVCKAYQADISDHDAVTKAIDDIHKDFGRIDIFIANAGISIGGATETYDLKNWHKQFDVNVHGVFYGAQAVAKYMLEQGKGSIIFTSSVSALVANRPQLQCAYNCTKSAVSMMAKTMAYEWARRGIRVNCINPGYFGTELLDKVIATNPALEKTWLDMIPMGRIADPKELRGAAVFLASDASSYVTGTELVVDGGYTCV
ncbi:NAD(P)-binding protein [Backusella circina FSU 941]|nr:NAD(P)-binding protein [Backusella circina FSU 941]